MINTLIILINGFVQIFFWLLFIKIILSYFLPPYHNIRVMLDRFFEPFLAPIRNIMPKTGMFDFSPIVLIILIQLIGTLLINILRSI